MRNSAQTRTFTLSDEDIDLFSDWLLRALIEMRIERHNCTRVRILMEEVLLRVRERLGEDTVVDAFVERRFGRPRLRLEIVGEPYNPLGSVGEELGSWESSLFTAIGLTPQYSYDGTRGILKLALPTRAKNPVVRIATAIAVGVLFGLVGAQLIPVEARLVFTNVLLQPLYSMWNRVLNAISGPIVFLTVLTTMLNTRSIEERGGNSVFVIVGYFVRSIAVVAVALLIAVPLFRLDHAALQPSVQLFYSLLDRLLHTVPSNIFEPFTESNTSQLLIIAFTLGCALVGLGSRVNGIKRIVREANIVGMQFAQWVSRLVPIVAGSFLCLEIWTDNINVLIAMWQPLFVSVTLSLITIALLTLLLSRYLLVSPFLLVKKILKPFLIALRTGTLDESFSEAQRSCTELLGIDRNYAKVGLPQGLVLYMPISAIGTIVFTIFVARDAGVAGNSVWYVSAIVMAVVVFVATPPVPGANLLAYVVLFQTLGIPEEALLDAMIFDIIFGIFAGAGNQAALQLEMTHQASRIGLLDKEKLHKPC